MKLTNEQKAMIASYARSVLASALAAYTASGGDVKAVLNAAWAAVIPVALRYLNSNDPAFGRKK